MIGLSVLRSRAVTEGWWRIEHISRDNCRTLFFLCEAFVQLNLKSFAFVVLAVASKEVSLRPFREASNASNFETELESRMGEVP